MRLFYKPGVCSLTSYITLRKSGKNFTLDDADLTKEHLENGDDLFAVSPRRQTPTLLLDGGTLLTEGAAIVQYLADNAPDRQPLIPTSSLSRYKTIEWLNYIATELHKGFTPLFHPSTPEDFKPTVRTLLEKKVRYINDLLKGNQWICGSRLSIADAYLFIILRRTYAVKLNMAGLNNIDAHAARMAECLAVAVVLKAEDLN